MGANAAYGNFRYNGGLLAGNANQIKAGDPNAVGTGWRLRILPPATSRTGFPAIQRRRRPRWTVPSFHRLRASSATILKTASTTWARTNPSGNWSADSWRSASCIWSRPTAMIGRRSPTSCPTRRPARSLSMSIMMATASPIPSGSTWATSARPDAGGRLSKAALRLLGHWSRTGRIPPQHRRQPGRQRAPYPRHAPRHLRQRALDPTYALQNANQGSAIDAGSVQQDRASPCPQGIQATPRPDNAGIDVRLTQLRNLLAGTRPQPNPTTSDPLQTGPTGTTNGDTNFVFGAWSGTGGGQPCFMPNGVADPGDTLISTNPPRVQRTTAAVPGRWGEGQLIPGVPITGQGGQVLNLVANPYNNPVRAGYSFSIADLFNGGPTRPPTTITTTCSIPSPLGHSGEVNDRDVFWTPPAVWCCPWTACAASSRLSTDRFRFRPGHGGGRARGQR